MAIDFGGLIIAPSLKGKIGLSPIRNRIGFHGIASQAKCLERTLADERSDLAMPTGKRVK